MSYDHEGQNTLKAGGDDLVEEVEYNVRGQMTTLDRKNGFDSTYTYYGLTGGSGTGNNDGRLYTVQHGSGADNKNDFKYFYDKVGNINQLETWVKPQSTQLIDTQTFTYDHLHRLVSADGSGYNPEMPTYSHSYAYANDASHNGLLGNMTNYAGSSYDYDNWHTNCGTPPSQDLPHAVHKVGTSDYFCYDGNGNMTIRKTGTITYTQSFDVENRLTQVTQSNNSTATRFSYDASGQRTKTEIETGNEKTITYYPFPNYEEEVRQTWVCLQYSGRFCISYGWSTTATIKRSTYHLAGQAIATRITGDPETGNNGLFYFLVDHLGSTTLMVTTAGVIMSTAYFLPFGGYRYPSTPPPSELTDTGFTGHKHNDSVGLIYMQARFYVPNTNRFLTPDTIIPQPTDPQSYNRYSYARNNPVNRTDPTGHIDVNCLEDCTPVATPQAGTPPTPLVLFDGIAGQEWTAAEMRAIREGALAVGGALARAINGDQEAQAMARRLGEPLELISAQDAFLLVYGGSVTYYKTGTACGGDGCYGEAQDERLIHVYTDAGSNIPNDSTGKRWAVHELGHAFEIRVNNGAKAAGLTTVCCYARNSLGRDTTIIRRDLNVNVGESPNHGFAGPAYGWQQSPVASTGEELADMYLGWVFGQWEASTQGDARSSFMTNHMSGWISLAVNR